MATVTEWNKYMNLLHEYALVEYDLRDIAGNRYFYDANVAASGVLWERFGVNPVDSEPRTELESQ